MAPSFFVKPALWHIIYVEANLEEESYAHVEVVLWSSFVK